jgi:transposase
MTSLPRSPRSRSIVVGVDTHKHLHVAVAIDEIGGRLAQLIIPVDNAGYAQLMHWARGLGEVSAFGVEGTGSYGAGLASFLRRNGHRVVEVNRPDRRAGVNAAKAMPSTRRTPPAQCSTGLRRPRRGPRTAWSR